MKIFESINDISFEAPTGGVHVAVGTFDGVHLAHSRLLGRVAGEAHATGGLAMVVTFQNHPRSVLQPNLCPKILSPWPLKKKLMKRLPIDLLVGIHFDAAFASMTAEDFVQNILVKKCRAKTIHSGKNFRFGKGGFGGPGLLEEMSNPLGFRYEQLEMMIEDDRRISSTRIRETLGDGDVSKAAGLLGRYHQISGTVITGDALGRTIGFPTANIAISQHLMIPAVGVYAGYAFIGDGDIAIPAITNHGVRPTVDGKQQRFEVHLLNWDGELPGKELTFQFWHRLRPEQKFANLDELKAQLHRDREKALGILIPERDRPVAL